jgi:hypothetical protein
MGRLSSLDDKSSREAAKKAEAKLKELKTTKVEPPAEAEPKKLNNDFDYAQLSYLSVKGYEDDDELAVIKKVMDKTGMELKEAIADEYVKNTIKNIREEKATKEATPSGTRRSQPSGRTTVDYWLAKGQLPPTSEVQLRRDVLNARIEREKQKSKFSDNPVVASM